MLHCQHKPAGGGGTDFHLLINPSTLKDSFKLSSGSLILMTIISKLRIVLQNISKRVISNVLINISPSNIFLNMLLPALCHQNCQAAFGRS